MPDHARNNSFRVEEATIDELHQAIRDGRTTCVDVVKQYIARARAYNGSCSLLVTESGIGAPADVQRMAASGVSAYLVGSTFMSAPDPGAELARLFATAP